MQNEAESPLSGLGPRFKSNLETDSKSLIPRVVTPPALRKMFPAKPEDKAAAGKSVVRKQTYSRGQAGVTNPDLDKIEEHPARDKDGGESGEETETHPPSPAAAGICVSGGLSWRGEAERQLQAHHGPVPAALPVAQPENISYRGQQIHEFNGLG